MNRGIRFVSHERRATSDGRIGSALILTVVLTSLLAIVGVLFVMMARVNQIATSGLSESRELDSAVETVIAKISQELALDVPRRGPNDIELSEYYDYPGSNDKWLASLEPYQSETDPNKYYWRHTSDIYGTLGNKADDLKAEIIDDYQNPSELEDSNNYSADADGDGVADSKWVEVNDITSSQGEPIYAAVRVVDNGGMINVNTAYKFDPTEGRERVDGSSQMQINLMALASQPGESPPTSDHEKDLLEARANPSFGLTPDNLIAYEQNFIWRYGEPNGPYTPFDISDELELRYRFLVNQKDIDTRLEELGAIGRKWGFREYAFRTPAGTGDLDEWIVSAYGNGSLDPNYAYRHIATTYNMDRIINPDGEKMVNVNRINDINDVKSLYGVLLNGFDPCLVDVDKIAAQIAVNLKDYRDGDSDVTSFVPDVNGPTYYGFERPCVYISELAHRFLPTEAGGGPVGSDTWRSYAVELYKPYTEDAEPNDWRLFIDNSAASPPGDVIVPLAWPSGSQQFHVIKWENTYTALGVDPNASTQDINNLYNKVFDKDSIISLQRRVGDVNSIWISVDSLVVPLGGSGWLIANDGTPFSIQRDITPHKCIKHLWASSAEAGTPTLGGDNNYFISDPNQELIQAHPANTDFTNIGEIGMVLRKSAYSEGPNPIGQLDTEADVRVDLTQPEFQQLFNYLTVFDPSKDGINNDSDGITEVDLDGWIDDEDELYLSTLEWKIPGRININTAPWFVLAQLPWMQYTAAGDDYQRAQEIAKNGPYENIGELMRVAEMRSLASDDLDQVGFPDLTTLGSSLGDGAEDDFEERDLIFARISNLVTVRSDVFTAYILVRIGTDGPQKRVIAILDRSDVYSLIDRVRIVAVQPVADPR